jgi:galactokinase
VALNFPGTNGADIAMSSDLPPASGLSSSSALVIGTFLLLSSLNNLAARHEYRQNITALEDLAAYLGCCENGQDFRNLVGDRGVGTFGGSQDHVAILCCKPGHLSVFSFCPVAHECDVELQNGLRFLIVGSGVSAEKTGYAMAKYNLVSERARWLLNLWNNDRAGRATCLRDAIQCHPSALVEMGRILERHAALDREMGLAVRLDQFLTESGVLISEALNAIRGQQWSRFGEIVDHSQRLAETGLGNQVPQTVAVQRQLRADGAIAASGFGAGFGGSVWALASHRRSDRRRSEVFFSRPSCPAVLI